MVTIDARGWECPKPIIETKRLLDSSGLQEVMTIVDNPVAMENLKGFAASQGYTCDCEEKDGLFYMQLKRDRQAAGKPAVKEEDRGSLLIAITSNTLGGGSAELGESLMRSYLYALTEDSIRPETMIFMNSGVFLTTAGTPVLDSLELLAAEGTEILTCGACLNYYHLQEQLEIGGISNMYEIAARMNRAGNTIRL